MNIITALGAIGAFVTAVIAVIGVIKVFGNVRFKTEKLYDKEAEDRYEALLRTMPEKSPNAFGPDEYKGGNKSTPQFEVERFYCDAQTMLPQWKKCRRTIRYYFEQDGKTFVRGWRLK